MSHGLGGLGSICHTGKEFSNRNLPDKLSKDAARWVGWVSGVHSVLAGTARIPVLRGLRDAVAAIVP
jgi:hypothetical protein